MNDTEDKHTAEEVLDDIRAGKWGEAVKVL